MVSYRTVRAHDDLEDAGESLVLIDGKLFRLSPIGTSVRRLAVEPIMVASLSDHLAEEFGVPEAVDHRELTEHVVELLQSQGLLEAVADHVAQTRPPESPGKGRLP